MRLGKFSSSTRTISTGAPQGCVLSPLLFSLYTNNCTSKVPSVKLLKFTDNTALIGLIQDGNESAYRQEVKELAVWCSLYNLELNMLKTVEMIVDYYYYYYYLSPLLKRPSRDCTSFASWGSLTCHRSCWNSSTLHHWIRPLYVNNCLVQLSYQIWPQKTTEGSSAEHWYNLPHSQRTVLIQSEKKGWQNHSGSLTSSTLSLWTVTIWSTLQSSEHQNNQTQKQFLPPSNPSHEHLTLNVEHPTLLYIIYSSHILIFHFKFAHIRPVHIHFLYYILCFCYFVLCLFVYYSFIICVLSCCCHSVAL